MDRLLVQSSHRSQRNTCSSNNTHVNENAYAYKWAPAGIEFNVLNADPSTGNFFGNTSVTDTDDELTHGFSTVQTGEFTYEFWIKIHGSKAGIDLGDPNFSNPDHFLEIHKFCYSLLVLL